jgi:hypothetical protein
MRISLQRRDFIAALGAEAWRLTARAAGDHAGERVPGSAFPAEVSSIELS